MAPRRVSFRSPLHAPEGARADSTPPTPPTPLCGPPTPDGALLRAPTLSPVSATARAHGTPNANGALVRPITILPVSALPRAHGVLSPSVSAPERAHGPPTPNGALARPITFFPVSAPLRDHGVSPPALGNPERAHGSPTSRGALARPATVLPVNALPSDYDASNPSGASKRATPLPPVSALTRATTIAPVSAPRAHGPSVSGSATWRAAHPPPDSTLPRTHGPGPPSGDSRRTAPFDQVSAVRAHAPPTSSGVPLPTATPLSATAHARANGTPTNSATALPTQRPPTLRAAAPPFLPAHHRPPGAPPAVGASRVSSLLPTILGAFELSPSLPPLPTAPASTPPPAPSLPSVAIGNTRATGHTGTQRAFDAAQRRQTRAAAALRLRARSAISVARASGYATTVHDALESVLPTGASPTFSRKLAARIHAYRPRPRLPIREFHPRDSTPSSLTDAISCVASSSGLPVSVIEYAANAALGISGNAPHPHPHPLRNERMLAQCDASPTSVALATSAMYGFDIGYRGPALRLWCDNHSSFYGELASEADKLIEEHIRNGWAIDATPLYNASPLMRIISHPQAIIPKSRPGAYRQLFDGSAGAYTNVNDYCDLRNLPPPKCATPRDVRDLISACAKAHPDEPVLLYTADLTNAYKSLPVLPSQWHLLAFPHKGRVYWQTVDPFGLRASSSHLHSATAPVITILQQRGVNALLYVDDSFTAATAHGMLGPTGNRALLREGFQHAGFDIQELKDTPPSTCVTYIGWRFDTVANTQTLPPAKLNALRDSITSAAQSRRMRRSKLEALLGHLHHAANGARHLSSFTSELQHLLSSSRGNHWVIMTPEARLDLHLWSTFIERFNGTTLITPPPATASIFTDACTTWGWGWYCPALRLYGQGMWPQSMRAGIDDGSIHINELELIAVIVAIVTCTAESPPGTVFDLHCDNTTAISCIGKGRGKAGALARLTRTFAYIRETTYASLAPPPPRALHVKGRDNTVADGLSRGQAPLETTGYKAVECCPTWIAWLASSEAPWETLLPWSATRPSGAASSPSAPPPPHPAHSQRRRTTPSSSSPPLWRTSTHAACKSAQYAPTHRA